MEQWSLGTVGRAVSENVVERGTLLDFFVKDTATTEIYTLSLPDALPIWESRS